MLLAHLRAAARHLRRNPGYALAAGVLALGRGANAAVFGVVDAALLRPFPYCALEQLVAAHEAGDVRQAALDTLGQRKIDYPSAMLDGAGGAEQMVLVVLSPRPRAAVAAAGHAAVHAVDPVQPVDQVATMDEVVAASFADRRLYAGLLGGFGALALALVAAGVYAVLAYAVAQRQREVGVRMALGARAADVTRRVVGQGARLALVDVLLGLAGALALGRA